MTAVNTGCTQSTYWSGQVLGPLFRLLSPRRDLVSIVRLFNFWVTANHDCPYRRRLSCAARRPDYFSACPIALAADNQTRRFTSGIVLLINLHALKNFLVHTWFFPPNIFTPSCSFQVSAATFPTQTFGCHHQLSDTSSSLERFISKPVSSFLSITIIIPHRCCTASHRHQT